MFPANTLLPSIEKLIHDAYEPSEPGAAILLRRGGQVLYRGGVGQANLEHEIPIAPEMPFRLASLTKLFTACAILMLEETGQLTLSDPITRFLPEYPMGETPITLEHLLTHTSGIQNYTHLPEWWAGHRQDLGVVDLISLFQLHPKVFAPGAYWAYNNSGYALLGATIEKVSGQTYGEFVEQRIFIPLGMQHSWYGGTASQVFPRLASGYSKPADRYVHPEYLSFSQVYAAGALISTVDDLSKWFTALCGGQIINHSTLERAWKQYHLADGQAVPYGYGWMLSNYDGHRTVEHYGFLPGYASYLLSLPDNDIFVAILSNNDSKPTQPERLAFELATLALGIPDQPPDFHPLAPEQLQAYTGQFKSPIGEMATVILEGESLFLLTPDGLKLEIKPTLPSTFFCPELPHARVIFSFDPKQQIVGLGWRPRQKMALHTYKIQAPPEPA